MKRIYLKFVITLFFSGVGFLSFSQSVGYYNGTDGKTGTELKTALNNIIRNHVDYSYYFAKEIINYSDADPENENNVILFYTQESRSSSNYGSGGDYINREHVWAKSHGDFSGIRPMDSDALNLRPTDASVNEDRSNKDFDVVQPGGHQHSEAINCWYSDSTWEPGPQTKGQVARILFYMATRYEGVDDEMDLEVVSKNNTYPKPEHGNLATLLEWNRQYPPSEMERRRNERIFQIQQNRNPFVDNPEFANYIWANKQASALQIKAFTMLPEIPEAGQPVSISIQLESNSTIPNSVQLFWGTTYDAEDNQMLMEGSQSDYTANNIILNYQQGELVYFKVELTSGDTKKYLRASYLMPASAEDVTITPISNVQGSGNETPILDEKVTVAGRVTANFDGSYYLQSGQNSRNGICIYDALQTGNIGDSIIVTGTATEYQGLTELGNVSYVYNYNNNAIIEPKDISISDINEDHEGMLVKISRVELEKQGTTIPNENKSFTFSNQDGCSIIFLKSNSRLVGEKIPLGTVDIVGIVSEYKGSYQILPRNIEDITKSTATSIESKYTQEIKIYPNPADTKIKIVCPYTITKVRVYDLFGKEISIAYNTNNEIDVRNFSPGIYILQILIPGNKIIQQKFVKTNLKL